MNEIEGRYNYEKPNRGIRILRERVANPEVPDIDDDYRRLTLGQLALVKRRWPDKWREMLAEIEEAKAA